MPAKLPLKQLKKYFKKESSVAMAFVFGSYAKGRAMNESDVDIAVYFKPEGKRLEWEEDKEYPQVDKIWLEVERIVKRNVDLLVLNRARSTVAFEVLQTGKELVNKDRMLYLNFMLRISWEAIDFMGFIEDYWAIEQRSNSLSRLDRVKLVGLVKFLSDELSVYKEYDISQQIYMEDHIKRRSIERWVENIANCSVDIAKTLLASYKRKMPDNYKDTMLLLMTLPEFNKEVAEKLAGFVKLRNLLAHEYLDFRFAEIRKFIEAKMLYEYLAEYVNKIVSNKVESP